VVLDGRDIHTYRAKEVARRLGLLPQSSVAPDGITVEALAQETDLLLLDEPTTFLDVAHQIELLELFRHLNVDRGRTLVAVLHDLNHACRYADHIVAMADGRVVAQGAPAEVVTAELVHDVFGLPAHVFADPVSGTPLVVPAGPPGRAFAPEAPRPDSPETATPEPAVV